MLIFCRKQVLQTKAFRHPGYKIKSTLAIISKNDLIWFTHIFSHLLFQIWLDSPFLAQQILKNIFFSGINKKKDFNYYLEILEKSSIHSFFSKKK